MMNTLQRYLFSCPAAVLLAFLLWLPCRPAEAATIAQVTDALDNPAGVTFTKMEYWKYKLIKENWEGDISYWFAEDDNGDYIYTVTNGASKWAVQTKTANTTTPAFGGSCIYSTGVEDGAAARLYLNVRGPGTLTFLYKTSCDDSDALNVYIDGDQVQSHSGYGDDMDWEEEEISIDGGRRNNVAYNHEIVFEYFKDEPEYDGKTKIPDGPVRDDFDTTAEYNEAKKYFHNCIWLDRVVWTPEPVDIALSPNPNPINEEEPPEEAALRGVFIDELFVNIASNAKDDFGYHIRYTTDGTTPTADSPVYVVEDGVLLTGTCTFKAKVFDGTAAAPIAVVPEIMISGTFQAQAAAPILAIDEGASTHDRILCTANTTTPDAVIFYTLTPDAVPDTPWPEGGLIVTKPSQIRAIARRANTLDSTLASLAIARAAAPVITAQANGQLLPPQAQAYTRGATLTITITAPSNNALYATSTAPGAAWTPYTKPLTYNNSVNTVTILARSVIPGGLASEIVSTTFYPASQDFTFGGDGSNVTLQDGWNLLGMPVSPTLEAMTALQAKWPVVFAIDPATKTLCRSDWLAQGEGFWLYCDQDTPRTLTIRGAVLPDTARPGWRLLTPALGTEPIHAWHWLTDEGAYQQQNLKSGQGGWKYSP
jgi:hypothetical protein